MFQRNHSRPISHQIGQKAVGQVYELLTSKGWIVDPIITDYGEDLMVRIADGKSLMPLRFFIQLKGTANISIHKKGTYYKIHKIKKTTASQWLGSNDFIMIILWDVKKRSGFYEFPDHAFGQEKSFARRNFVTASLSETNIISKKVFDAFKVDLIEKYCIKHYYELEGTLSFIPEDKNAEKYHQKVKKNIQMEMLTTIFFYLTSQGIIREHPKKKYMLTEKFHKIFMKNFDREMKTAHINRKSGVTAKVKRLVMTCLILAFLEWRGKNYNRDTHEDILLATIEVLFSMFGKQIKKYHSSGIKNKML